MLVVEISQGLYEVINSEKLSLDQKSESIRLFAWPVHHLDGEYAGMTEPAQITEEDAELIIEALTNGSVQTIV